jgi:predicted PurR-regulated permease PerM
MWALWVFRATAHFLFLLLLAWLIAIAMEPPIRWLVRHHLSRILATTITGIGAIIVFLGVGAIFANELAKQISQLVTA